MTYRSLGDQFTIDVEQARAEVYDAQLAYSRGEGLERLNAANRKLADAHEAWRTYFHGHVPENL